MFYNMNAITNYCTQNNIRVTESINGFLFYVRKNIAGDSDPTTVVYFRLYTVPHFCGGLFLAELTKYRHYLNGEPIHGTAQEALNHVIAIAKLAGYSQIQGVVADTGGRDDPTGREYNKHRLDFFKRNGFKVVGRVKNKRTSNICRMIYLNLE